MKRSIAGRETNAIGLGCMSLSWAYGTPPARADAQGLLHRALDLGYDHLDTANIYGLGHNETLIGETLSGSRDRFFLATKMGIVVDGERRGIDCSPDAIRRSIDASLTRLRTDRVDLYYMHRFDPKVPIADMMGAMGELVAAGKIGGIGVSEWSATHIREAHRHHPIAAVQSEYSLWSREPEIAVLDACRELDIAFVAFSPVGRGALAAGIADPAALPEKDIRRSMPRFQGNAWVHNAALIADLETRARSAGGTAAQLAIAWVLSRGPHIHAIPGTADVAHLAQNIARADWLPDQALLDEVDAAVNQRTVIGGRYSAAMQQTIDTESFT